jgi:hypothetical protein
MKALLAAIAATCLAMGAARPAMAHEEGEHDEGGASALDIAGDVEGAAVVEGPHTAANNSLGGGTGFKVRVGEQLHFPFLRVVPEIGYGYEHFFAEDSSGTAYDWNTHRLIGGLRIGLGEVIVPMIYGHVGYGWRMTGDPSVPQVGGVAADGGVAVDLHIIPHLGLGVHGEYGMIDARPYVPQWVAIGVHADLAL